jgi:ubiquinone/menaquinone biosynthesis C-methylase UbiE
MKANWPEKVWINSPLRLLVQKREVRFLKNFGGLQPGARCLEIGCGRGAGISLIEKTFHPGRVDAVDIDLSMIRRAMSKRLGLLLVADAQQLPYPDSCMDAVFNFGILHHLEDWVRGIGEISRILKNNSRFYFEEIYPSLYANFFLRHLLAHPRENRFHGPEFRAVLADTGLKLFPGYKENRFGILGVAVKNGD